MKRLTVLCLFSMLVVALGLTACGGGSGSGSGITSGATNGVVVDPYIVGATFFVDANQNGIHDVGELLSSASDYYGRFSFEQAIEDGALSR